MAEQQKDYFAVDGQSIVLVGASTDPKSYKAPVGSEYEEYDTGLRYIKTPVGWRLKGGQTIFGDSLDDRPDPAMVPKNTTFCLGAVGSFKTYTIVSGAWVENVPKVAVDQTITGANIVQTIGIAIAKARTTVLANSLIVKASSGTLYSLHIYNKSAITQYYQTHDSATVPADGVAPIHIIPVMAGGFAEIPFGENGMFFSNGLVVCNSTTDTVKTIGAADSWIVASYV